LFKSVIIGKLGSNKQPYIKSDNPNITQCINRYTRSFSPNTPNLIDVISSLVKNCSKRVYISTLYIEDATQEIKDVLNLLTNKKLSNGVDVKIIFQENSDKCSSTENEKNIYTKLDFKGYNHYSNYHTKTIIVDDYVIYFGGNFGISYMCNNSFFYSGYIIQHNHKLANIESTFFLNNYNGDIYNGDKMIEKYTGDTDGIHVSIKPAGTTAILDQMKTLFNTATKSIRISSNTPYICEEIFDLLRNALNKGITIEFVTNNVFGISFYYLPHYMYELMKNNKFKCYIFDDKNHFIHEKYCVIDDKTVLYTSQNLSYSSVHRDIEFSVVMNNSSIIGDFIDAHNDMIKNCYEPNKEPNIIQKVCFSFDLFCSVSF